MRAAHTLPLLMILAGFGNRAQPQKPNSVPQEWTSPAGYKYRYSVVATPGDIVDGRLIGVIWSFALSESGSVAFQATVDANTHDPDHTAIFIDGKLIVADGRVFGGNGGSRILRIIGFDRKGVLFFNALYGTAPNGSTVPAILGSDGTVLQPPQRDFADRLSPPSAALTVNDSGILKNGTLVIPQHLKMGKLDVFHPSRPVETNAGIVFTGALRDGWPTATGFFTQQGPILTDGQTLLNGRTGYTVRFPDNTPPSFLHIFSANHTGQFLTTAEVRPYTSVLILATPTDVRGAPHLKIDFESSKVTMQNIPSTRDARRVLKSLPRICVDDTEFDLLPYLTKDSDIQHAVWYIDGNTVTRSFIPQEDCPDVDEVTVFNVHVEDSLDTSVSDSLIVVLIPTQTNDNFDSWYQREVADLSWLNELPAPYRTLAKNHTDPEPLDCTPKRWGSSHLFNKNFHPGAVYEIRSEATPGGHGHQVTYDADGHIIIQPILGAGSADKGHPSSSNPFAMVRHFSMDVIPFVWAAQLDGNPVECNASFCSDLDQPLMHWGRHMDQYFVVRPVWARTTQSAGTCGK
jgi:hypothetical protein